MRSLLAGFTTRGTSFLAAGLAAGVAVLALGERDLVSVGALLFILPLLSALAAGRARYRLSCVRQVSPPRVPAGHTTHVSVRLENVSRLPTGLLLAEDAIPYALGTRPRYVLDGVERGGVRELNYPLRSDLRGKFTIGPLEVRIADSFGLVELGRSFATTSALVVTPKVIGLPRTAIGASWVGEGEGRTRAAAAAREDDVVPRAYRDGDELRRVHWRSTARYGELMVRREEQRWRNRALLFLDTRRNAHAGTGVTSSFEYAVGAAASIGVHLARGGMDGQLITDGGQVTAAGMFEDVLLDSLAVIKASRGRRSRWPRPGHRDLLPREALMTASESSSTSSKIPVAATGPASVMSWPSMPPRARCTPIEAAAPTAYSKDEVTPVPACALRRVSSSSSARLRQRCSSRRTISSPYRAVDRQCTRRSSSPSR